MSRPSGKAFGYTCERCFDLLPMTAYQYRQARDRHHRLYCAECKEKMARAPKRKRKPAEPRDAGCTVTASHPDGTIVDEHRRGPTLEALAEIVALLPPGSVVHSISTPRTILHDLRELPRRYGSGNVDAYSAERVLLGKIGRLDLLPAHAQARRNLPSVGGVREW